MSHVYPAARGHPPLTALEEIRLEVGAGEVVVVLGPSGCGKSTLLNLIAGLIRPTSGTIAFVGERADPGRPLTAVVFQEFALFPWRTVLGNVGFGLECLRLAPGEARERARQAIRLVGLEGFTDKYPHELSGGMKQRAAMARALAVDPVLLLLDEPLSALDAQTRTLLQGELMKLWAATGKSFFHVTHNIEEAVFLAHRIVVLSRRPGRIREIVPVGLPHPRDEGVRLLPAFAATVAHCWGLIRDEAQAALLAPEAAPWESPRRAGAGEP